VRSVHRRWHRIDATRKGSFRANSFTLRRDPGDIRPPGGLRYGRRDNGAECAQRAGVVFGWDVRGRLRGKLRLIGFELRRERNQHFVRYGAVELERWVVQLGLLVKHRIGELGIIELGFVVRVCIVGVQLLFRQLVRLGLLVRFGIVGFQFVGGCRIELGVFVERRILQLRLLVERWILHLGLLLQLRLFVERLIGVELRRNDEDAGHSGAERRDREPVDGPPAHLRLRRLDRVARDDDE
jgi:hypothetical protein